MAMEQQTNILKEYIDIFDDSNGVFVVECTDASVRLRYGLETMVKFVEKHPSKRVLFICKEEDMKDVDTAYDTNSVADDILRNCMFRHIDSWIEIIGLFANFHLLHEMYDLFIFGSFYGSDAMANHKVFALAKDCVKFLEDQDGRTVKFLFTVNDFPHRNILLKHFAEVFCFEADLRLLRAIRTAELSSVKSAESSGFPPDVF
eukprot:TRINITY_DN776447_c0_g1_i1.p1 TRINITY_DN776447_c0_g1~~TRINITY_DN776447_c0_g1_i1.p1  ORF type:complete len:203 (-),score=37.47 TRINITY_DN776447_c0_g1_i1:135-743(-)